MQYNRPSVSSGRPIKFPQEKKGERGGADTTDGDVRRAFTQAVHERGLASPPLSPALMFRLVRDMPYRRPSGTGPLAAVEEWCGTCSTKHRLLQALFGAAGISSRLMTATYSYRWTPSAPPPPALGALLADGPIPDVHNFLEVWAGHAWRPLDATWPLAAERLGFAANPAWAPGAAHRVACVAPFRAWAVPPAADPRAYKEAVVQSWCGGDRRRRERLIALLGDVLREAGLA